MGRNHFFQFKQFRIEQHRSAMKVGIDVVLLGAWADVSSANHLLDVGTGTGVIALMLAQRCAGAITGVEIDHEAALEARYNADLSPWPERITIAHSSFQDFAAGHGASYDLIVSNPPFFGNGTKPALNQRASARHNDRLPLQELLGGCVSLLHPKGSVALVLPAADESALIRVAFTSGLIPRRITRVRPNPLKPFHRILVELCRNTPHTIEDALTIEGVAHFDYTDEYRKLTSDFYPAF